ncbi:MAG: hypothetical protein P1U63_04325 [Coxiellaceae bacterium]|nr:hypothetical protein [Coxiellaceae bacterium]
MPFIDQLGKLEEIPASAAGSHPITKAAGLGASRKEIYALTATSGSGTPSGGAGISDSPSSHSGGSTGCATDAMKASYQEHLQDIMLESAYIECLVPALARELFGDVIIVPNNYMHVDATGNAMILSQFTPGFSEFLAEKEVVRGNHPSLWGKTGTPYPRRADFALNQQEAENTGVLYVMGIVFNHWDLLNSQMRNSGQVTLADGSTKPCVIDWGLSLHQARRGRLCAEGTVHNPLFKEGVPLTYNFDSDPALYAMDEHSMPFDGDVYPLMSRSFVRDLFDMGMTETDTGDKAVRDAMLAGAKKALDAVNTKLSTNPDIIDRTIAASRRLLTVDSAISFDEMGHRFNASYYGFDGKKEDYNLTDILSRRIKSLNMIVKRLEAGETLVGIAEEVRDDQVRRQTLGC